MWMTGMSQGNAMNNLNMNPNQNTPVAAIEKEDRAMEYIPFGSDEKIKLSIKIIQNIICIPTKSGRVCEERDAMKFMMLCKARALNPFEGDSFLMGYESNNGSVTWSLITAHQAFLKRAEPHPEFAGMRSGVVTAEFVKCPACDGAGVLKSTKPCRRCNEMGVSDEIEGDITPKGATLHGGWATIYFKNRPEPMHKRVSLAVFKKPFGRWNDDPAGMIVKCAEADALRSSFPTKLGGLYLKEEVDSIEAPRQEPTKGIFGQQPMEVEQVPAMTEMEPQKPQRRAKLPPMPAEEAPAPATPAPAPKADLVNDKTRLAQWLNERGFGWAELQPIVSREVGNWADSVGSFEDLNVAQAKAIYAARAGIETALVPAAA